MEKSNLMKLAYSASDLQIVELVWKGNITAYQSLDIFPFSTKRLNFIKA
jgi:hypothetical protein